MNTGDSLNTSFWLMVFLQTMGSVDMPGHGDRKMPAPRSYVAILITWTGLNILASTGREHAAAVASWVMVLTGLVIGPFGSKLTGFLTSVANNYGIQPPTVMQGSNSPRGTGNTP